MTESSRRQFFRELRVRATRQAREVVQEAGPLLRTRSQLADEVSAMFADDAVASGWRTESAVALDRPDASTPTRCLEPEELGELVRAEGLESRLEEIRSLIRRSVRITRGARDAAAAQAWLDLEGGLAVVEPDVSVRREADAVLLAQVSLSAPALLGTPLAGSGWLAVFVETVAIEAPTYSPALRANVVPLDHPAALTPTSQPMAMAAQLVLPRVWNAPVQALGLAAHEHEAYVRLRDRLAEYQGVEIEHGGGADRAYHRLLGYPDETTGTMPADCAAAVGEGDWRLLAQVSVGSTKRVYVWVADDGFERAVAFAR